MVLILLNCSPNTFSVYTDRVCIDIPSYSSNEINIHFSISSVYDERVGLNSSKGPVPDGNPPTLFKHCIPLLFNLFLDDIEECFKNSQYLAFADDLNFFSLIASVRDIRLLQKHVQRWCFF